MSAPSAKLTGMEQYITVITLAVEDRAAMRRFFVDGLGWAAALDVEDVLFLRVGPSLVLSLWDRESFVAEVGEPARGLAPITLAHNVSSDAEVDAVLDRARAAGALTVQPGQRRDWGGYSGYFVDPAGYHWEVAHAPGGGVLGEALAAGRAFAQG